MQGHNIPDISMTLWESYHKKLQEVKTRVFFYRENKWYNTDEKRLFQKEIYSKNLNKTFLDKIFNSILY